MTNHHNDTTTTTENNAANTHTLDTPIERDGQTITRVTLSKPDTGALRGTSLAALVNLDVDALCKVLPRITTPTLHPSDIRLMDPADLVTLGGCSPVF